MTLAFWVTRVGRAQAEVIRQRSLAPSFVSTIRNGTEEAIEIIRLLAAADDE